MAQSGRSFLPLTGAVFAILFILTFLVGAESPGADDPVEKIVNFYRDNESSLMLSAILGAIGSVFFLFFVGHLRSVLRASEGGLGTLSSVAAGGGIIATTGMLIFSGFAYVLSDGVERFEPATVQTLNALNANFFFPLAGGLGAFLLATGLVAVRTGALPGWLAWIAVVLGLAVFTPLGFFAFLASILWVLVTSVWLWTRQTAVPAPTV